MVEDDDDGAGGDGDGDDVTVVNNDVQDGLGPVVTYKWELMLQNLGWEKMQ